MQQCHEELSERISVTGNYEKHECGLEITGLVEEDGGNWECEVGKRTVKIITEFQLLPKM